MCKVPKVSFHITMDVCVYAFVHNNIEVGIDNLNFHNIVVRPGKLKLLHVYCHHLH